MTKSVEVMYDAVAALERSWADCAAELASMMTTKAKALESAETVTRQQCKNVIDAASELSDPSALGYRLRAQLQAQLRMTRTKVSSAIVDQQQPLPETTRLLVAEWDELASECRSEVERFIGSHRKWQQKIFRRQSTQPLPSRSLLVKLDRLDQIHRKVTGGFVDTEVRQHVAIVAGRKDAEISEVLADRMSTIESLAAQVAATVAGVQTQILAVDKVATPSSEGPLRQIVDLGSVAPRVPDRVGSRVLPDIPALLTFPFHSGVAIGSDVQSRAASIGIARSVLLQLLGSIPPGKLHVKAVDPIALGQSVAEFRHLAEYDSSVMDEKTWTSDRDIERLMADLSDHLELVISRYLRGQFDTIDEYNQHAGEVAEPYRLLTIFDYPSGFTPRASKQLLSLIENGPRCGVYTVLHYDKNADTEDRYGEVGLARVLHSMRRVGFKTRSSVPLIQQTEAGLPSTVDPAAVKPSGYPRFQATVRHVTSQGLTVSLPDGSRGLVWAAHLRALDPTWNPATHKEGDTLSVVVVGTREHQALDVRPATETNYNRTSDPARPNRDRQVAHLPFPTSTGDAGFDMWPHQPPSLMFDADGEPLTEQATVLSRVGASLRRSSARPPSVSLDTLLPVLARTRSGNLPDYQPDARPLERDSSTWWQASTSRSAVAPIGRSGAQGITAMHLSSTTVAGGAIMVGLPRSGKTTSLHSLVLTLSMLYSPDELELYLIDAKHGVEFKIYENLPHARMVSVHSEREFSLAVLKSIETEIKRRAELMKAHGGGLTNITEYREATREVLPRIVVVVDEFHEIFEEADAIGMEAFSAFSNIVRMGPFSGVHMIVASQTLSGMPAMDRPTLTLLPQRIAFMCNDYDAEIVMGDTNKAARLLSKTGEGLYNPARGDEAKNQPFQGLYVPTQDRAEVLRELAAKADASGFTRRPRVFDGDAAVARPPIALPAARGTRLVVPIGEPLSLAADESITLSRTRGSNVLIVGDTESDTEVADLTARGVLHSILVASAAQTVDVTVVDFVGDEDLADIMAIADLAESTGARYIRSRGLPGVLAELSDLVATRLASEDYRAPAHLLVLFGVQRALSLTAVASWEADPDNPAVSRIVVDLASDGPEVGVHLVIDVDRLASIERRLGKELLDEALVRVAGSETDNADLASVTGEYGSLQTLRHGHLLLGNLVRGTSRRIRGYRPVSGPRELESILARKEEI